MGGAQLSGDAESGGSGVATAPAESGVMTLPVVEVDSAVDRSLVRSVVEP